MPPTTKGIASAAVATAFLISFSHAATIVAGDVTTTLGPNFFIDDAALGGQDFSVNQPNAGNFDRDWGSLNTGAGGSQVSISGIGWATPNFTGTDATSATVTITYLGLDGLFGGSDDVVIGSVTDAFTFSGANEMVWAFDSPLVATIDGANSIFRVSVAPLNGTGDGSLRFKTLNPTGSAASTKLSVAGTSTAVVPEPSVALLGAFALLGFLRRRR